VCERVARRANKDVLIVKNIPKDDDAERDTILVGIDGSPQSFGALMTAIDLAKRFGKKVEAIAVYDPYLHYTVFNGIVNVLTEKAAKVFRFEEQNQLHEEVIDTGLAQIYQSHLEVAGTMAAAAGVEIQKTLLDGKAFQKVLNHARKTNPWLLAVGRIGIHSVKEETDLGSNTDNLFRNAPCNILLTTRLEYPALDVRAEQSIRWTPEAEQRMTRVPALVQGIARTAIFRLAIERGHSVITSDLLDEAMDRYMPKGAKAATKLAEAVVLEHAAGRSISICRKCGVSASEANAVVCSVCGSTAFQVVTPEMVEQIIEMEGGGEEEIAYDGRKLTWTRDAKQALWTMQDAYKRRRVKARVEKAARLKRMSTVSLELARGVIEEETGAPVVLPVAGAAVEAPAPGSDGKKLIARDAKKNPLFSELEWTADAVDRVLCVPAGFMRNRTQNRIEEIARERGLGTIDLALVEDGLEDGRKAMEKMIKGYQANPAPAREVMEPTVPPRPATVEPLTASSGLPLNEVGIMAAMEAKRRGGETEH
jgi:nucleotide-binding universal stress UspA family protein